MKNKLYENSLKRNEEDIYPPGYVPQYYLYLSMFIGFLISIFAQAGVLYAIDTFKITSGTIIYITISIIVGLIIFIGLQVKTAKN